jgi:hypothetical protein
MSTNVWYLVMDDGGITEGSRSGEVADDSGGEAIVATTNSVDDCINDGVDDCINDGVDDCINDGVGEVDFTERPRLKELFGDFHFLLRTISLQINNGESVQENLINFVNIVSAENEEWLTEIQRNSSQILIFEI